MQTDEGCDGGLLECRRAGGLDEQPSGYTQREAAWCLQPSFCSHGDQRQEGSRLLPLHFFDVASRDRLTRNLNDDNTGNSNHKI